MTLDQITGGIAASIVRFTIAAFILWVYYKNKNKFIFYTGMFFLLLGFHGVFRTLSLTSGSLFLFFLQRIALTFAGILLMYGLGVIGVGWIRKLKIIHLLAIISVLIAYYDAYILNGFAGDATYPIPVRPAFAIAGLSMLIAAYYFSSFGKYLPHFAGVIMIAGLALEGLLLIVSNYFVQGGLVGLAFLLGTIFTGMVGLGAGLSLYYKEAGVIKKHHLNESKENK